jgi:hypothetical protein
MYRSFLNFHCAISEALVVMVVIFAQRTWFVVRSSYTFCSAADFKASLVHFLFLRLETQSLRYHLRSALSLSCDWRSNGLFETKILWTLVDKINDLFQSNPLVLWILCIFYSSSCGMLRYFDERKKQ